ncbi:MAG TPA: cold-shock protein [Burkholderiales bacterium]|nr:cold-shock protein [Burkholderiales bacterium]
MAHGKVKWFDRLKGFGFIAPDNGTKEVFVHISALKKVGMTTLSEGQKVEYEVVTNVRGGYKRAEKLKAA